VVGAVDSVWDYVQAQAVPAFGLDVDLIDMDPLSVEAAGKTVALWLDEGSPGNLHTPSPLWLAADYLRKVNTSGGDPYGMYLPFDGADRAFEGEPHGLPFVDYLRLASRRAAFRAWRSMRHRSASSLLWRA
jgi:hypothetical protein